MTTSQSNSTAEQVKAEGDKIAADLRAAGGLVYRDDYLKCWVARANATDHKGVTRIAALRAWRAVA